MIKDLWYKNAVVYCLSVATYMDANGDGIGGSPFYGTGYYGGGGLGLIIVILLILVLMGRI